MDRACPSGKVILVGAWIAPVLTAEWARVTRSYVIRMGLDLAHGVVEERLVLTEPTCDTALARAAAGRMLAATRRLTCVWSGVGLRLGTLDIDHVMPWSVWPYGERTARANSGPRALVADIRLCSHFRRSGTSKVHKPL